MRRIPGHRAVLLGIFFAVVIGVFVGRDVYNIAGLNFRAQTTHPLTITSTGPDTMWPGRTTVYTATIRNNTAGPINDLRLALTPDVTFLNSIDLASTDASCALSGLNTTCGGPNGFSLAAGASRSFQIGIHNDHLESQCLSKTWYSRVTLNAYSISNVYGVNETVYIQPFVTCKVCGDGIIKGEGCDDRNTIGGDGCAANCSREPGWTCAGEPSVCSFVQLCANGIKEGTEACDDHNTANGDGCSSACAVESGWTCSGSPSICSSIVATPLTATITNPSVSAVGGKHVLSMTLTIQNPNSVASINTRVKLRLNQDASNYDFAPGTPECSPAASPPYSITNPLEINCPTITAQGVYIPAGQSKSFPVAVVIPAAICDFWISFTPFLSSGNLPVTSYTSAFSFRVPSCNSCGDGAQAGAETCDDGNTASGDGCSVTCSMESGWTCSGSPSYCAPLMCGGYPTACSNNNNATCAKQWTGTPGTTSCVFTRLGYCSGTTCTPYACGDGTKTSTEACDDGNNKNGDGCAQNCVVESGWTCTGTNPSSCIRAPSATLFLAAPSSIDKSGTGAFVATITNPSSTALQNAVVSIGPLSAYVSFIANRSDGSCSYQDVGSSRWIRCNAGTIPAGQTVSRRFSVGMLSMTGGFDCGDTFALAARLNANNDPITAIASSQASTTFACYTFPLTITPPASISNTTSSAFTLTIHNTLVKDLSPHITIPVPAGLFYDDAASDASCVGNATVATGITCTPAIVHPGQTMSLLVSFKATSASCGSSVALVVQASSGLRPSGTLAPASATVSASAPVTCPSPCGNGIKEGTEACDDNNTANGDGCSSACAVESGWTCTGSPSVCAHVPANVSLTILPPSPFEKAQGGGTFVLHTVNNGSTAQKVFAEADIPSGLGCVAGQIECDLSPTNPGKAVCYEFTLQPGQSHDWDIWFCITNAACNAPVTLKAAVKKSVTLDALATAQSTATVSCPPTASLTVTGPTQAPREQSSAFTFSLKNTGTDAIANPSLLVPIPTGFAFDAAGSDIACQENTAAKRVTCYGSQTGSFSLAAGQTKAFIVSFHPLSTAVCGSTVTVSGTASNPLTSSLGTAQASTVVTCPPASSASNSCGNGTKEGTEACDDGNARANDGCSAACAVESGWTCTGSTPSICIHATVASSSSSKDCSACPATVSEVCGTDNRTYDNSCFAYCLGGVTVAHDGACATPSSSSSSTKAACNCQNNNSPVCGIDGVTYRNMCEAQCADVPVSYAGACRSSSSSAHAAAPLSTMEWTAIGDMKIGATEIESVAYGNGKFVALGRGQAAYSTDGVTWHAIASVIPRSSSYYYRSLVYGNGKFVTGDSHPSSGSRGAYSTDGITWTTIEDRTFQSAILIKDMAYGNGTFVAVGDCGKGIYSLDGITWKGIPNLQVGDYCINSFNFVAYGDGKFTASYHDGDASYSLNGITWTASPSTSTKYVPANSIAYGNGKFVAVADNQWAYSTDGITWTVGGKIFDSDARFFSVAYGDGRFVAVSANGIGSYLSDGNTWTPIGDMKFGSSNINAVTYSNGMFVAVGSDGKGSYSGTFTPDAASCTDSDGGSNYGVRGTVTDRGMQFTDECSGAADVMEWYCHNNQYQSETHSCAPGLCANGACVAASSSSAGQAGDVAVSISNSYNPKAGPTLRAITSTVTVTNRGSTMAYNVLGKVTFSSQLQFVPPAGGNGPCAGINPSNPFELTCGDFGADSFTLMGGESRTFPLTFYVNSWVPCNATTQLTASVTSTTQDPNSTNNQAGSYVTLSCASSSTGKGSSQATEPNMCPAPLCTTFCRTLPDGSRTCKKICERVPMYDTVQSALCPAGQYLHGFSCSFLGTQGCTYQCAPVTP